MYLMEYNNHIMTAQPHPLPDALMTQEETISKQLIKFHY